MKYEVRITQKNPYFPVSSQEIQKEIYLAESRMNNSEESKLRFQIVRIAEYNQKILDDPEYGL